MGGRQEEMFSWTSPYCAQAGRVGIEDGAAAADENVPTLGRELGLAVRAGELRLPPLVPREERRTAVAPPAAPQPPAKAAGSLVGAEGEARGRFAKWRKLEATGPGIRSSDGSSLNSSTL